MTIQDDIITLLGSGMLLSEILELEGMPSRQTVYRWLREDAEFAEQYEQARMQAADVIDEEIHRLGNAITPETATATRVQIEALKWRCSKLHPLRYAAPASTVIENSVAVSAGGAADDTLAWMAGEIDRLSAHFEEQQSQSVERVLTAALACLSDGQLAALLDSCTASLTADQCKRIADFYGRQLPAMIDVTPAAELSPELQLLDQAL